MNAKELLSILDEDFSDTNVEIAIAWLKTKKPTNKSAGRVLQQVFNHPKIQQELNWLSEWAGSSDWRFISENVQDLRSIEIFDWIVELLKNNPDHQDAGRLWSVLLQTIRHEALEPGATEWLNKDRPSDEYTKTVLEGLLRLNPTENLVIQAKQLYKESKDVFLLSSLIEYAGDEESFELGAAVLISNEEPWQKEFIAIAMAKSNLNANKRHLYKLLSNNQDLEFASRFLARSIMFLGHKGEFITFVCDWIELNYESKLSKELLSRTLILHQEDESSDALYHWFRLGAPNDIRFEIFIRAFENSWCPLPEEAKSFVLDWISKNPQHRLVKHATNAVSRLPANAYRSTDGSVVKSKYSDGTMSALILSSDEFDDEALTEIRKWTENFPVMEKNVKAVFHVFKVTSDPADLEPFRKLLPKVGLEFRALILSELVTTGLQEFIDISMQTLRVRRLYKRFEYSRNTVGGLILELLKVQPDNEEVKRHAEGWLKISRDESQSDMFKAISNAVEMP